MGNNNPLVSFCLFCYNQENFVKDAVIGALNQSYSPLEIIISDDCSTDNTYKKILELTSDYNGPHKLIVVKNEKNLGFIPHVNKILFDVATGGYLALAAGDDISTHQRIAKTIEHFKNNPELTAISCSLQYIDSKGDTIPDVNNEFEDHKEFSLNDYIRIPNFHINGASRVLKKEVLSKFGKLNKNCPTEDSTFLLRSLMLGKVGYISEKLVQYRWHMNNMSSYKNIFKLKTIRIFKQYQDDIRIAQKTHLVTKQQADALLAKAYEYKNNRRKQEKKNKKVL